MTSDSSAVLVPKLFPISRLTLGQLLPNPLKPSVFSHTASILANQPSSIISATPESPYNVYVSLAREGRMSITLTKTLGLNLGSKSGNFLKIDAEEMQYTSLERPEDTFKSITEDADAAAWIKSMAKHHKDFYLVVGLQVLKNAKFQRVIFKKSDREGHITLPLDHLGQLPIEAGMQVSGRGFGTTEATVSGIFGIEVRKVKCSFWKAGDSRITDQISWVYSHEKTKGKDSDEVEHISVHLDELATVEELEQLLKAAGELDDEEEEEE